MLDRVRFIEDEDVTRCSLISYKKKKRNSLLIFTFFTLFSSSCFLHMFSANSLGIYFQKTVASPYDLYFIWTIRGYTLPLWEYQHRIPSSTGAYHSTFVLTSQYQIFWPSKICKIWKLNWLFRGTHKGHWCACFI